MKKLLYVLAIITLSAFFTACEQEDVSPIEQPEVIDPDMTEGNSDKEAGGVKGE